MFNARATRVNARPTLRAVTTFLALHWPRGVEFKSNQSLKVQILGRMLKLRTDRREQNLISQGRELVV